MERIVPGQAWPLYDQAGTRALEQAAAAHLPPHMLMQRAGLAVARLARALAPHARSVWVACGPGNNGGDGLEAAALLAAQGLQVTVTRPADPASQEAPPPRPDLAIDALFGIGRARPLEGAAAAAVRHLLALREAGTPVLAVDLPSGLDGDTGTAIGPVVAASHTLSLLTLKPGLFTAQGRDCAGEVWFDDLGCDLGCDLSPAPLGPAAAPAILPTAILSPAPLRRTRPHASHKGTWGDVAVIGGAPGMTGAALLAASAALHAGAGRVFVGLLGGDAMQAHASQPELMFRPPESLDFRSLHLACGCGGGQAVRHLLPRALSTAASLVLDADALNALAADTALFALLKARTARSGRATVITPHPLEAARLLGLTAAQVQADRLGAARQLVEATGAVVVLKGSGTVIAAPGQLPLINPTGNPRLASGGTGDVLAGWIAALLAQGLDAAAAAVAAVYAQGAVADRWPAGQALTASSLARAAG